MKHIVRVIAAGLVVASAGLAHSAPPVVTSVYPARQRIDAPRHSIIEVIFDQLIDPASVDGVSFRVFGRWSGPATGTVTVNGPVVTFTPSEPFFAGEWVTINLSNGIQNLSAESMVKGYAWNFWIQTADGTLTLTYVNRIRARQGAETWVQIYGAYAGDLNNDGLSDLTVPCEQTSDARVFLNNAGTYSVFTTEALTNGNVPSPNEGADFDNDGEIDVVVANTNNNKLSLLFGDGTGDFPNGRKTSYNTVSGAQNSVRGVGVVDLNGDGWDDIVAANRFANNLSILLNNGDGTFAAAVAKEAGGNNEYTIAIADANNDGQLDVFCGTFNNTGTMIVLLSDGNGGLTEQPPVNSGGIRPWQTVVGDFNKDGNADVASCNSGSSNMGILFGNGAGGFTGAATTVATDAFDLAIDAGDVDGDGDLELVTSNYDGANWNLFENVAGAFVNKKVLNASSAGSCAILHDRDNDGDLDLTGFDEVDDWLYFYRNNGPLTGVGDTPRSPVTRFENQPNPFNPSTLVRFDLAVASEVDLSVYDASGAFVANLDRGAYPRGAHDVRWNGTDSRGQRVGSGIYFCRLTAGGTTLTRKMVLLK